MEKSKLFIVATPIGNLSDISIRALDTLKSVDLILCEDTRVTKRLLDHYSIDKKLLSFHQHSDSGKIRQIKELLKKPTDMALVTDAGTPGISDPGNKLIAELIKEDFVDIVPVPGPNAAITALSISGFPTDKFAFLGFPPHKNKRQKFFKAIAERDETVVFYESGHRIKKCLAELGDITGGGRKIVVCRELTKKFETIYRGTIDDINKKMQDERGEFVLVVSRYI